jgi:hypothetical protein
MYKEFKQLLTIDVTLHYKGENQFIFHLQLYHRSYNGKL